MNMRRATTTLILLFLSCSWFFIFSCPSGMASTTSQPERDTYTCRMQLLDNSNYFKKLMSVIEESRSEIIMSFFLFKTNGFKSSYTDRILNSLVGASKRGVTVTVILEQEKDANSMINRSNRATTKRLKSGGIKVFFDSPETTTHTKVAVIDNRYIFLGSHNLTNSALKYNNEISLFVDSPEMARETINYITKLHK
jgi:phosphatidylserine/phosphatidylglycerophosphate/cardiolipin synthase-like enzyme